MPQRSAFMEGAMPIRSPQNESFLPGGVRVLLNLVHSHACARSKAPTRATRITVPGESEDAEDAEGHDSGGRLDPRKGNRTHADTPPDLCRPPSALQQRLPSWREHSGVAGTGAGDEVLLRENPLPAVHGRV